MYVAWHTYQNECPNIIMLGIIMNDKISHRKRKKIYHAHFPGK